MTYAHILHVTRTYIFEGFRRILSSEREKRSFSLQREIVENILYKNIKH